MLSVWTLIIGFILILNISEIRSNSDKLAKAQATANLNKDQAIRLWATLHGGVYVPIDSITPPNQYLTHIKERDIETREGKKLTLMNPAYLVRQLNEYFEKDYGIVGHITSLKLLRPENKPDEWERKALEQFEKGVNEISSYDTINGERYYRLIHPMKIVPGCLKCHGHQDYKVGEIRGGVSVSIPMQEIDQQQNTNIADTATINGIIWISVFILLLAGFARFKKILKLEEKAEQTIKEQNTEILKKNRQLENFNTELESQVAERTLELEKSKEILSKHNSEYIMLNEQLQKAKEVAEQSNRMLGDSQAVAHIGAYITELTSTEFHNNTWKASPELYRIFGIDQFYPHTLAGWVHLIHPDSKEEFLAYHNKVVTESNYFDLEYKIIRISDGVERWVHGTGEIEYDKQLNPVRMVGTIQDITGRKLAELELSKVKDHLEKFFSLVPALVTIASSNGYLTNLNPEWEKVLGYTVQELESKPFHTFIHPDDIEPTNLEVAKQLKGSTTINFHNRYRHKDGSYRWLEWKAFANKDAFLFAAARDITESKLAEEALKESQRRLTTLISNLLGIAYRCKNDPDWTMEFISNGCYSLTGYMAEEIIGNARLSYNQIIHPEDRKSVLDIIHNALENKKSYQLSYRIISAGGEEKWVLEQGQGIFNTEGNLVALEGYISNINELKQAEQKLIIAKKHSEECDRLKSAFLANMSHEIRTPMNGIIGFAEILKEPNLTGKQQQEYIQIIEKSGVRLLDIINEIVDISKIEAGLMDIRLKESNINDQLEYIHTFFKPEAAKKGIQLIVNSTLPSDEAIIITDNEKVYAVLINLVKNAVKFTMEGFIEFGYLKKGDFLEFYVKDTGVGIPKNRQSAIFERFMQVDIFEKMAQQGAGLGLSITKAYIEMLGGKIWVESEEGKGSIFYFTLPYNAKPKVKSGVINTFPAEDANTNFDPEALGLKILIVEDDAASEKLMSIMVKPVSKIILKARTGPAAIEACSNNPDIDLILMDIHIPEISGYEATRQIRQFNKDVFIVAQTAFGLTGDREKAIEAGCNDYISKPINKNKLLALIQNNFRN